jgi:4-alpha-glucanotransferase
MAPAKYSRKVLQMEGRGSGIFLHITSLPSLYGIGDLGPEAYRFADFLGRAKQRCWQVLPLNPVDPLYGNSPYSSVCAFAGNTLLISPDLLVEDGLLSPKDLRETPSFPAGSCDFPGVIRFKRRLLDLAYQHFAKREEGREPFEGFCSENAYWLEDYSLFVILKKAFKGKAWNQWPKGLSHRNRKTLQEVKKKYDSQIDKVKFMQYLFYKHWQSLRTYCQKKGIFLFGDLAIYVTFDSADVWANPGLFKLTRERKPAFVSGVPPDYFSKTGQLWGNPVYRWDALKKTGYRWWIERIAHNLTLFDVVRIDHFLGLVAYWEIPAGEKTAVHGKWVKAPAHDFLDTLSKTFPRLPVVAEDLGVMNPDVKGVMDRFGVPGMKVLLFAFGEDDPMQPFLPHAYEKNFVVYTGTHDNNTVRGWFEEESSTEEKKRLFRYLGRKVDVKAVHWSLIRLAMMSVARWVILPMQDVLGLGQEARMNRPSVARGNWTWRMLPGQMTSALTQKLSEITETYGRG